jgi:hypothetical protein
MLDDRIRRAVESLNRVDPTPPPIETLLVRRRHRRQAGAAAFVVVAALAVGIPLAVLGGGRQTAVKVVTTPSSVPVVVPSIPVTVPTVPTTAPPAAVAALVGLPLVVCPTSFLGSTSPTATPPLPSRAAASVPASLAAQLAVYSDSHGIVMVVGPRGWDCAATYYMDGNGGVAVYPEGETAPPVTDTRNGGGYSPTPSQEVLVAHETSACGSCAMTQACPVLASASRAYQAYYGKVCPFTRPSSETVKQITSGVATFVDPADVAGDGIPSGGPYPAYGAVTFDSLTRRRLRVTWRPATCRAPMPRSARPRWWPSWSSTVPRLRSA